MWYAVESFIFVPRCTETCVSWIYALTAWDTAALSPRHGLFAVAVGALDLRGYNFHSKIKAKQKHNVHVRFVPVQNIYKHDICSTHLMPIKPCLKTNLKWAQEVCRRTAVDGWTAELRRISENDSPKQFLSVSLRSFRKSKNLSYTCFTESNSLNKCSYDKSYVKRGSCVDK